MLNKRTTLEEKKVVGNGFPRFNILSLKDHDFRQIHCTSILSLCQISLLYHKKLSTNHSQLAINCQPSFGHYSTFVH